MSIRYLRSGTSSLMMQCFDRITWNPAQMNGQPCVRGMRLTVRSRRAISSASWFQKRQWEIGPAWSPSGEFAARGRLNFQIAPSPLIAMFPVRRWFVTGTMDAPASRCHRIALDARFRLDQLMPLQRRYLARGKSKQHIVRDPSSSPFPQLRFQDGPDLL